MRLTTGILLWVVAAAAATAVGLVAVSAIGTDIFGGGQDPLSQSQVDELLSSSSAAPPPTTTSSTPPTSTTTTPPQPQGTTTATEGGTVISRCAPSGLVEIVSATPAQGFSVDKQETEVEHTSVRFRAGHQKVEIRLTCVGGVPQPEIKYD